MAGLWVSSKPEGRPFLYVRNLAPGRAILRAGRDEQVIAIVRNGEAVTNPGPNVALRTDDILVLLGSHQELDKAAEILTRRQSGAEG